MAVTPGYVVIQTDDGVQEVIDTPENRQISQMQGFNPATGGIMTTSGSLTATEANDIAIQLANAGYSKNEIAARLASAGYTAPTAPRTSLGGEDDSPTPIGGLGGTVYYPEPGKPPVSVSTGEPVTKTIKTQTPTVGFMPESGEEAPTKFTTEAAKEQFLKYNIKLDSGEFVSKADYDLLSADERNFLKTSGINAFNEKAQEELDQAKKEVEKDLEELKGTLSSISKEGTNWASRIMTEQEISAALGRKPTKAELEAIHAPDSNVKEIVDYADFLKKSWDYSNKFYGGQLPQETYKRVWEQQVEADKKKSFFEKASPVVFDLVNISSYTGSETAGLGQMSLAEIKKALGRTPTAAELEYIKEISVPIPSFQQEKTVGSYIKDGKVIYVPLLKAEVERPDKQPVEAVRQLDILNKTPAELGLSKFQFEDYVDALKSNPGLSIDEFKKIDDMTAWQANLSRTDFLKYKESLIRNPALTVDQFLNGGISDIALAKETFGLSPKEFAQFEIAKGYNSSLTVEQFARGDYLEKLPQAVKEAMRTVTAERVQVEWTRLAQEATPASAEEVAAVLKPIQAANAQKLAEYNRQMDAYLQTVSKTSSETAKIWYEMKYPSLKQANLTPEELKKLSTSTLPDIKTLNKQLETMKNIQATLKALKAKQLAATKTGTVISPATLTKIATQAATETETETQTQTQTETETQTETKTATETKTGTETKTETETKTKPDTKTVIPTKTITATTTGNEDKKKKPIIVTDKTTPPSDNPPPPGDKKPPPPPPDYIKEIKPPEDEEEPPPPPPGGGEEEGPPPPDEKHWPGDKGKPATQEERQEVLPENKGAVAWKQGALFGKPVINVLRKPFKTSEDLKTTVGQVPAGVTLLRGKGSAKRSAVLLTKPGPSDVTIDSGFQDLNIKSGGNRVTLTYTPDPKGLTTHAIRVGRPRPPSQKRPRVTLTPSRKVGKQYFTPMGGATAISRRPLGKRSKGR